MKFKPLVNKVPFDKELIACLDKLKQPAFTQKDTPFSPRMLNYYDSKALLLFASEKGKKRLFTAEQLFWIFILHDTAKLGYTLIENLQDIRHRFENTFVIDSDFNKFTFLQYVLAYIIYNKQEQHLKIDADGSYSFFNYHNLERIFEGDFFLEVSHINISLGPIAKNIWKKLTNIDLEFTKPSISTATYSNKEIIQRLESGDFERIEIVKKKDGTSQVDIVERLEPATNDLNRAMALMSHGKITINYGDKPGKPVSVIKEKRVKPKK